MQKVGIEIEGKPSFILRGVALKHDEIIAASKECRTYAEIAKIVGFTSVSIANYMKANDIAIEGRSEKILKTSPKKNKANIKDCAVLEKEPTMKNWYAYWYHTYRRANIQEVTRRKYEGVFGVFSQHAIANMKLKNINRGDAQNYMNWYGEERSKNTVYDHWQLVRSAFEDAVADGHIKLNPFRNIRPIYREQRMSVSELKEKREQKKWLEMDEYMKLKYHLIFWFDSHLKESPINSSGSEAKDGGQTNKQVFRTIIFVALKTGARIGEVLGLTRDDILFETDEINVEKTWDYKTSTGFKKTKNLGSIRKIYTDKETMQTMRKYIDWLDKYDIKTKEGTLFIAENVGTHLTSINYELKKILNELEIEVITMHKLRHTQASILIAKDVPLQLIAKRLGHTDTMMIQRVYGHLLKETEDRGNKMIAGFL
ncbi:Tyrosine recombinase XerC [bioreactor metagenome]|uniref:Tyrosine recombinase XerC n=1 Tax=bioreactor metagenome TaxID=1076179 RepID=A0A645CP43_9ZZZZ